MNTDKICGVIFIVAAGLLFELGKTTVDLKNTIVQAAAILFLMVGVGFFAKGYFSKFISRK